jgi:hypothetical protein
MRAAPLAAWLLAVGCVDAGGTVPITPGDRAAYVQWVQPILEARCATLDCHGDAGRALRLYAPTGRRLRDDLRVVHDDGGLPALVDEEITANLRSIAAVRDLVIPKPLAGGLGHEGGEQWRSPDEPQVVCVQGWLDGKSADPGVTAACTTARDEVKLSPP